MKKFLTIILFLLTIQISYGTEFDAISPANPLTPQLLPSNTIALPVKKATLTHNNVHNQYVLAFDRFMRSNIKSAYNDFKILIETMDNNDYAYMKFAENMADIGFFDLTDIAISKIEDKAISDFLVEDIKLYYYPANKIGLEDEIYLGEVFSNIVYNDQSNEATSELVKNDILLNKSDYANYIASLGYLKSNNIIEADKYIDVAIKMNPSNLNYKKLKAEILSQSKKPQNAIKMISRIKSQKLYSADFIRKVDSLEQYVLYKSKKNYSEKMYHLGYYYYLENEYAKSLRTLQSALSTKKKLNEQIYALLSRVYYDSQDYEKAQDSAQKAKKLNNNNIQALLVLGDLSYRNKDYKTALKYYKNADANSKNSYLSSIRIAQVYENTEKLKKANDIYEKLLKSYDDCYIAYYKIGLSDKSKELAYMKKSISINMNFKDAWLNLAKISIEQQNYEDAKRYLRNANYIDENDFRYYYYQGLLAKKQGLNGSKYFEKSLLLNPDYKPAKEELNI